MTVGERIKQRRKELKLSADIVAEKIGVSRSTIFRYEKGEIEKMPTDVLALIADALHTTPGKLMGWDTDEENKDILPIYNKLNTTNQEKTYNFANDLLKEQNSNIVDMRKWKDVYIQSKVSAGRGIVDLDQQHKELISYDGYVPSKYDLAFQVEGNSMEPMFRDEEVIFVVHEEDIRNGQLGVVTINDEAYIKKIYLEDDCMRLVSLNKEYTDIIADSSDNIKVVGKVIL